MIFLAYALLVTSPAQANSAAGVFQNRPVVCWLESGKAECRKLTTAPEAFPVPAELTNGAWKKIAVGVDFLCAASTNGGACFSLVGGAWKRKPFAQAQTVNALIANGNEGCILGTAGIECLAAGHYQPAPLERRDMRPFFPGKFEQIASASLALCARAGGYVTCAGIRDIGGDVVDWLGMQRTVSELGSVSNALSFAVSGNHQICVLRRSGDTFCAGNGYRDGKLGCDLQHDPGCVYNQLPAAASSPDLLIGGSIGFCALKYGQLACWGREVSVGAGDAVNALLGSVESAFSGPYLTGEPEVLCAEADGQLACGWRGQAGMTAALLR